MILLIEQNKLVRNVLQHQLELDGYNVITARNGAHAYALLKNNDTVKVILSSVKMPIYDGEDLLRRLSEERAKNEMPYWIFMSNDRSPLNETKWRQIGANAIIPKPFKRTELFKLIEKGSSVAA